jgi:hypothetical protein
MDARWLIDVDTAVAKAHAYPDGSVQSLCGQRRLPMHFTEKEDADRCGNCQRVLVQQLRPRYVPIEDRWRDVAVRAVLGDSWSYDELASMPTHRAEVDRVAIALADAFREGILQANASARTG